MNNSKIKFAIYCRTDDYDKKEITRQKKKCIDFLKQYALKFGFSFDKCPIFIDYGVNGEHFTNQGLIRLIKFMNDYDSWLVITCNVMTLTTNLKLFHDIEYLVKDKKQDIYFIDTKHFLNSLEFLVNDFQEYLPESCRLTGQNKHTK